MSVKNILFPCNNQDKRSSCSQASNRSNSVTPTINEPQPPGYITPLHVKQEDSGGHIAPTAGGLHFVTYFYYVQKFRC